MVFSHFGHKFKGIKFGHFVHKNGMVFVLKSGIVPVCCSEKATISEIMFWVTDSCNTMVANRVLKFWSGHKYGGRCGGLMVSALDSGASGPG